MAGQSGNAFTPSEQSPSVDSDTVLKLERDSTRPAGAALVDPVIGLVLANRYRIDQRLGVGGMGTVYRAVHVHMKNTVALKVLHPQMLHVPEAVARFEREAVAAARIEHPNVAKALDFGRLHDGTFYMALEFIEGVSLRELLKAGPLPTVRVVGIMRQIAEALQAAHEQGIVHRDLKPENVMLLGNGKDVVKVLDFGIAKVSLADTSSNENQLTKAGAVFGTPDYMSPEQAGGKDVDHRTDLYALGILAYELLSGSPPFSGDSIAAVLLQHLQADPPPFPPQVDWRVADLIHRLLAKDPVARPASAKVVVDELVRLRLSLVPARPATSAYSKLTAKLGAGFAALDLGTRLGRALALGRTLLRSATERWPALRPLSHKVAIGPRRFSVAALLLSALASALVVSLVLGLRSEPEPSAEPPQPVPEAVAPVTSVAAQEPAPITRSPELEALLAMPVYKRKVPEWRRLAQLHGEAKQWSESVSAYRNAVQLDKGLAKDPVLLQTLRNLLLERESYEAVTNIAVNLLGEAGIDMLYDAWLAVKDDKKQRTLSDHLRKQLEIHHSRRASKSLKVALELQFAAGLECPQIKKIVLAAIKHADTRSVQGLSALEQPRGCGFDKQQDCYPCLRDGGDLEAALHTAKESIAPRFDGSRYVPAP